MKRFAVVNEDRCVSCGACTQVCPRQAISVYKGCFWPSGDGAVQAENLVHLLPDGDYDADDLQDEAVDGWG